MTGLTAQDLIASTEPPTVDIEFCRKPALILRWEALHDRWEKASPTSQSMGQRSEKAQLAEQLRALDEQMKTEIAVITARALDGAEWGALKAKHPRANGLPGFDPDTFAPAALAACAIAPTFTLDEATQFIKQVSDGQREQIVGPIVALNQGQFEIPFDASVYAGTSASDA